MHDYVRSYLENLPLNLRPTEIGEKVLAPLRIAWRNKWDPKDLARAVGRANYSNANNPAGLAIYYLNKFAEQPPIKQDPKPIDTLPVEADKIPKEWSAERWALIRKCFAERTSSDEAQRLMQELIARQEQQN